MRWAHVPCTTHAMYGGAHTGKVFVYFFYVLSRSIAVEMTFVRVFFAQGPSKLAPSRINPPLCEVPPDLVQTGESRARTTPVKLIARVI